MFSILLTLEASVAGTAQQTIQTAGSLRTLAQDLTQLLDDSTVAASEMTWVGPAADRYRAAIAIHQSAVEQIANDLCLLADRVECAQKLMMMSAH